MWIPANISYPYYVERIANFYNEPTTIILYNISPFLTQTNHSHYLAYVVQTTQTFHRIYANPNFRQHTAIQTGISRICID